MLQNVDLSAELIIVVMPLALFGVLGLAAVVLVHGVAEVVVMDDVVRACRAKPSQTASTGQSALTPVAAGACS